LLLDPDNDKEYGEFVRQQVTELFTDFGPIDVLFIDGAGAETTKKTCWDLQPDCLITRGAIKTPEQYVPGVPPEGAWESCLTMGTQWSYKPTNDNYKSGTRILELLIETRSKGGALLMNVGPKPDGQLPIEQEERLREVALWHAVNGEAIHDTRPWVVAQEGDIWFTKEKDGSAVYAFLTRIPDWPRGQRREFLLQSVEATPATRISVLGHGGQLVEYSPDTDATPRFQQTDRGLQISVVRAQRLYNDHKWHNPVVVKLENVRPAFETPPYVETVRGKAVSPGRVELEGDLTALGEAGEVTVGFEYQVYGGFAEAMYNTEWTSTETTTMAAPGKFSVEVQGLKPATEYQFRAVVTSPKITMRGDHKRVGVK
jgi:alpha-L-fucosidase